MDGETTGWRKASFSGAGDCVEWCPTPSGVLVRDSKDTDGPALSFTHREWRAFVAGIKAGEGDLPD